MGTRTPHIVALIITMAYGISFAVIGDPPGWYALTGGIVVALAWVIAGAMHNRAKQLESQPPR